MKKLRMTPRLSLLCTAACVCVVVAAAVGCQTYDFSPVGTFTIKEKTQSMVISKVQLKPNLMFLIDRSGSMSLPFTVTPACTTDAGNVCGDKLSTAGFYPCDPTLCPSRWYTLSTTANSFLQNNGTVARMGVTFFPDVSVAAGACGAAGTAAVTLPTADDATTLQSSANAVAQAISAITETGAPTAGNVGGGTPTGDSVLWVANNVTFDRVDRSSFMLLMTDGLPNCDATFQPSYSQDPAACDCTSTNATDCSLNPQLLCNDYAVTSQKIANAAANGIKTIVVGYGDLTGSTAPTSLQSMAVAGGFQRRCYADGGECNPTDSACFNPALNPNLCAQQYFLATSQAQLAAALLSISKSIPTTDPCVVTLSPPPSDPRLLSVDVTDNGTLTSYPYGSSIWTLTTNADAGVDTLTFQDPLCTAMRTATDNITYVIREATVL